MRGPKVFVLDTNVLLLTPEVLQAFTEGEVVIPINVIEEMDVVLVWNGAAESSTVMWDDSTGHFDLPGNSRIPRVLVCRSRPHHTPVC